MGVLAAQVGVNRTTLYRCFGSKDQVIADALGDLAERTLAHREAQREVTDGARTPQLIAD